MNSDHAFMARALELARKGLYSTHPNPRVGCVIVRDGRIVGEGWHARAGEPHAEVHALRQAGDKARGATAYVTLEPCSHHGRTPPCADALINAGVARVVAAMQDPNPQVGGDGLLRLMHAGIAVQSGVLETEARALNAGFIKRMEKGLPFVRVKLAMSLDGRTAMASGESQWITGPAARAAVQRLRARASVVLTGADTVLADDARLTVRPDELGLGAELSALAQARPGPCGCWLMDACGYRSACRSFRLARRSWRRAQRLRRVIAIWTMDTNYWLYPAVTGMLTCVVCWSSWPIVVPTKSWWKLGRGWPGRLPVWAWWMSTSCLSRPSCWGPARGHCLICRWREWPMRQR